MPPRDIWQCLEETFLSQPGSRGAPVLASGGTLLNTPQTAQGCAREAASAGVGNPWNGLRCRPPLWWFCGFVDMEFTCHRFSCGSMPTSDLSKCRGLAAITTVQVRTFPRRPWGPLAASPHSRPQLWAARLPFVTHRRAFPGLALQLDSSPPRPSCLAWPSALELAPSFQCCACPIGCAPASSRTLWKHSSVSLGWSGAAGA